MTTLGWEDFALDPFLGSTAALWDPSALATATPQRRRDRPAPFPIDVTETPDSYKIKADMAGYLKDNIQVSFEDQTLRINAERAVRKDLTYSHVSVINEIPSYNVSFPSQ